MKKPFYLFLALIFNANLFAQVITPEMFVSPSNTGENMTIGVNANELDSFVGGQIGAFYDFDGDGTLECVGLETISTGFLV